MSLVVKDRVKEVTTTTGTADFTLGGSTSGYQSFAVIGDGNTTYYAVADQATGDWEVGIGTYSSTGPTLTRDTVLESSNAGSKVNFAAGSKDVFCTYPAERSVYLSAAGSAVDVLDIGTLGTSTANITTANITAGTVSTTPASGNDLVNKTYVDTMVASGITYHAPVKYEVPDSVGNLNATYDNGTAGVGATLTNAGTLAAFNPDGTVAQAGDRILIYNQTNAFENGVYTVTTVGDGSTPWVLTRATDADSYGVKSPTSLGQGDAFFITAGNTGAGETYVCNTVGTITFGTTAITFAQVSDSTLYTAGTGLTLSGTQFSITPTGTAGTYGSGSQVPVITTNASGQVTNVVNTAIAITSGAVSGLAASATTDTTNAANISSGTLGSDRLTGSYTGITGVGTLTAGTWNGSTIGAGYGGTGFSSYTVGDILYANGTSSLAKLAGVVAGNALISGGVGGAPSWGKIGLTTHVSGTLPVANGGTGATDAATARTNLSVPSTTGGGASGSWGISITGSAAQLGGKSAQDGVGANTIPTRDSSGYTYLNYINSNTGNSENPTVSQVIVTNGSDGFYRKASIGHLTGSLSGTAPINVTGSAGAVAWGNVSSKPSNIMYYQGFTLDANTMDSNATGFTYSVNAPYTGPVARFSTGGGYDLWLNAPYGGGNALAFRTRNGDAASLNAWKYIWHDGNMDAPNKSGTSYYQVNTWLQLNGAYGLYCPSVNGAHFKPNDGTYGAWRVLGSRNGWRGLEFEDGLELMMNYNAHGIHRNDTGWMFYVESRNFYSPGNVTAYWSDARLKENLQKMDREALDILGGFNAYRFNWNAKVAELGDTIPVGKEEIGLIAQHVQKVLPDAVVVNKAGAKLGATDFDYLTINYDRITPLLVEGVNIHDKEIADLKARVAQLEALVAKLTGG